MALGRMASLGNGPSESSYFGFLERSLSALIGKVIPNSWARNSAAYRALEVRLSEVENEKAIYKKITNKLGADFGDSEKRVFELQLTLKKTFNDVRTLQDSLRNSSLMYVRLDHDYLAKKEESDARWNQIEAVSGNLAEARDEIMNLNHKIKGYESAEAGYLEMIVGLRKNIETTKEVIGGYESEIAGLDRELKSAVDYGRGKEEVLGRFGELQAKHFRLETAFALQRHAYQHLRRVYALALKQNLDSAIEAVRESGEPVIVLNRKGFVRYASKYFKKLMKDECVGKHYSFFVSEDERDSVNHYFAGSIVKENGIIEERKGRVLAKRPKDGKPVMLDIINRPIVVRGVRRRIEGISGFVVRTGRPRFWQGWFGESTKNETADAIIENSKGAAPAAQESS